MADTKLESLKKADLEALAEQHGIDASGTKADIIERLEAADIEAPETEPADDDAPVLVCSWCGKTPYDGDQEKLKLLLHPGEDVSAPPCIHCGHNPR